MRGNNCVRYKILPLSYYEGHFKVLTVIASLHIRTRAYEIIFIIVLINYAYII